MWNIWCVLTETLLLRRAEEEGLLDPAEDENRFRGRGSQAKRHKEDLAAKQGPLEIGTTDLALKRLDHLRRRLLQLSRLQRAGRADDNEAKRLWSLSRRSAPDVLPQKAQEGPEEAIDDISGPGTSAAVTAPMAAAVQVRFMCTCAAAAAGLPRDI